MKKTICFSTLFFFLIAPTVFAQSFMDRYAYTTENNYSSASPFKQKNEGIAIALTVGVPITTILIGRSLYKNDYRYLGGNIIAAGIFIGPSAGNMYARNFDSVLKGVGTKLLGAGAIAIGTYQSLTCWDGCPESKSYLRVTTPILFAVGIGIYAYSFIYDAINAPNNVRKYNNRAISKLSFGPTYYPEHSSAGLGFSLTF